MEKFEDLIKECIYCKCVLPLAEFKKDKRRPTGRSSVCYTCFNTKYPRIKKTHDDVIIDMPNEQWGTHPKIKEHYLISNMGRIKSINFKNTGKTKLMTFGLEQGYVRSTLIDLNGEKCNFVLHRLVAEIFIPNHGNKPQVNHINGIKTDNRVENLEWCTSSENNKHAFEIGLRSHKGEKQPGATMSDATVTKIINDLPNLSVREICAKYNTSEGNVYYIKNRGGWSHLKDNNN